MAYFPMFISIEDKPCLVVGGGRVALRKARGLLDFGARVTLVAETVCAQAEETLYAQAAPGIESLHNSDTADNSGLHKTEDIHICLRSFREDDLQEQEWALVVAATDDRQVNSGISAYCHKAGIPVNVADCREECTFYFPAYCKDGDTVFGISTSGRSPSLAKHLREKAEENLPQWLKEQEE